MTTLLDFLYLDIRRLESFASQLFEGLPSESTRGQSKEVEFGGEIKGGVPLFAQAAADTRAVLSATSNVSSRIHHYLVRQVIDSLKDRMLLSPSVDNADDGSFVILEGRLQIVDPRGLASTFRVLVPMMQTVAKLQEQSGQLPELPADPTARRIEVNRRQNAQRELAAQDKQLRSFADLTDQFGGETVRIRMLQDGETVGSAVGERDKFVESLDRIVLRHGYLMGGRWKLLGQVNMPGGDQFFEPEGGSFLDLIEKGGMAALQQVTQVSAGSANSVTITPLAIFREIAGPRV